MADKVYTSAEFKRERDNFHVSFIYLFNIWFMAIFSIYNISYATGDRRRERLTFSLDFFEPVYYD